MLKKIMKKSAISLMAASLVLSSGLTVLAEAPDVSGTPVLSAEMNSVALENDSTYKVTAVLRKKGSTDGSMAGGVLEKDAEIIVDSNGMATAVLSFVPTVIFEINVHATDFKLYVPGTKDLDQRGTYVLSEDNSAICKVPLDSIRADGTYVGKIFSNIMNSDLDLYFDWSTLKKENDLVNKLREAVVAAKEIKESEHTPETYAPLKRAIADAEAVLAMANPSNAQLQEKEAALNTAKNNLVKVMANPFISPSTTYYLDVKDEDNVGAFAIIQEAVVKTDVNGMPTVTVKFKKYTDFLGDYIIKTFEVLGRDGSPLTIQNYTVDTDGNGVLTFPMNFFPPNGRFKANVTASNADPKTHDLVFDWATIRTTADFRPLNTIIETATKVEETGYTTHTFKILKTALEEAKVIAADMNSSQDAINKATEKLKAAYEGLLISENNGKANNANLGTAGFNAPFMGGSEADMAKPWAGSRIHFGKNNMVWKVLDPKTNLLMLDADPIEIKFTDSFESTHWDKSNVREKLNGEFYNTSFTNAEKKIILDTELETVFMDTSKPEGEQELVTKTTDKVFILTLDEYKKAEYGFHSDASRKASMSYWTRNRVGLPFLNMVASVSFLGGFIDMGMLGNVDGFGAIPSIRIDSDRIFMTTPAGSKLPSGLQKIMPSTDNNWQLTLKSDTAMTKVSDLTWDGTTLKGMYSTDFADATPTIGILKATMTPATAYELPMNTELKYYGSLDVKDGQFAIQLPSDFNPETDTLFFSAEKDMMDSMGRMAAMTATVDWKDVTMVEAPKIDTSKDAPKTDDKQGTSIGSSNNTTQKPQMNKIVKKDMSKKAHSPKTGDQVMIYGLLSIFTVSVSGLVLTTLLRKRR